MTRVGLGITEALSLKPLVESLESASSPFQLHSDLPAKIALAFAGRTPSLDLGCAFLTPIDYARHGGEYQIVPRLCVASAVPTKTIQLFVKQAERNISRVAVDIRVTSEIILANIILLEKYPNLPSGKKKIEFLPMLPDLSAMLDKADAALVTNFLGSSSYRSDVFALDLVEEWTDLTDLPYVHGFWVGREENLDEKGCEAFLEAKRKGAAALGHIAVNEALKYGISTEACLHYLSSFIYDLGPTEEESLSEFLRYAFLHGVLGDVPDLNFFSLSSPSSPSVSSN